VTPFSRLLSASVVFSCVGVAGASGAWAFDLNPFHLASPAQPAQSTPPAVIPGVGPDSADPNDPAAMVVRLDRLEDALRQANGRIEELENQQRLLQDQLKRFQQDVEYRLGGTAPPQAGAAPPQAGAAPVASAPPLVAAAPGAAPAADLAPGVKPRRSDAFDPNADPNAPGAPRPLGSTPPSAPLSAGAPLDIGGRPAAATPAGPLAAPTGPIVADVAPAAVPGAPTVTGAGVDFTDAPRQQFNAAVDAYRAGQYAQAEELFKAFLTANGSHRLAPDAIFYLGETYFQRSRPREAAEQYLKLSTDYGKSSRAPEGMLRLGQSLAMLGSNEQACATFAEVGKRYPTAAPPIKKSAEREMQKDHC
jgi:tol-pal system protein YbgF